MSLYSRVLRVVRARDLLADGEARWLQAARPEFLEAVEGAWLLAGDDKDMRYAVAQLFWEELQRMGKVAWAK